MTSLKIKFLSFFKKYWPLLTVILLTVPSIMDLLQKGFFPMHDDLQIFRLFELHKCVLDLQIPCRWVPDAGFGYGYPLMQFYPPMPYYPMEALNLLGFGFFWSVKIMFALSFVISGIGMYLLAAELFGVWGGILSSVLYVYAPYHSVDVYVRGAMNEAWGMAWFPFVLLYLYKIIKDSKDRSNFIYLSIFLCLQLTSHNVMTMVFAPTAIIWAVFWIAINKNFKVITKLIYSGILGVGLSAFFFIPVVLEQRYVHVDSMMVGYFNFLAHFADLKQLFTSRFWGYGGSTWGPEDGMSFSVGQFQWGLSVLAGLVAVFNFKKNRAISIAVISMIFFAFGYAFLTHSKSVFFWDNIHLLQYSQFPWRLVALVVFYFCLAAGYLFTVPLKNHQKTLLLVPITIAIITFNLSYFRVDKHVRVTLEEKLSGLQWENQVTGGIFDYLPRSAPKPPGRPAPTFPQFVEGEGSVLNYKQGTNWQSFDVKLSSPSAKVMVPLYNYQGLKVKVDNKLVDFEQEPELGRVMVSLQSENKTVYVKVGYTAVRLLSDIASLISLAVLIYLFLNKNGRK